MENTQILELHHQLQTHPVYKSLQSLSDLKIFMKWHSFAVWDFMSLLKSLQVKITCVDIPWRPSPYPKEVVRFINEIVLGEESDQDGNGGYTDHFSMYIRAMDEVGAPVTEILSAVSDLSFNHLPQPIVEFVNYNLQLSKSGLAHEVAAAFFYGRENLVPDIFEPIVAQIKDQNLSCPNFKYYLERHIELDGEEHGELAKKCLDNLIGNDENKREQATLAAKTSLILREKMWSFILGEIERAR